jgi:hypothetical protein
VHDSLVLEEADRDVRIADVGRQQMHARHPTSRFPASRPV